MVGMNTTMSTDLNATINGATCVSVPEDPNQRLGLLFNGVDNFVELDNFEFGGPTTIEMYLKVDEYNSNSVILDFGSQGADSFSIGNEDELMAINYNSGGGYNAVAYEYSTSHFSQKAWDHVVLVILPNATWTIYKNGNQVDSRQQLVPTRTIRDNHGIGNLASAPSGNWFQGIIGFLKIYKGYR